MYAPLLPQQPTDRAPASQDTARTSDVTRLLSAGAETDPVFAQRVVTELVHRRDRFAAPSYGYDAVTVLGHALAAQRRRRNKQVLVAAAIGQWLLFGVLGPELDGLGAEAFWITLVLWLWGVWAANLHERVLQRQTLTLHLRRPFGPRKKCGFHGVAPMDPVLTEDLGDQIRQEQDTTAGVVFYSGYEPFVGAGTPWRTWSFAVLLEGADGEQGSAGAVLSGIPGQGAGSRPAGVRPDPEPFTAEELTAYVERELNCRLLAEDLAEDQRLTGLEVCRRLYARAVGPVRPDPARRFRAHVQLQGSDADSYDGAREYLCVRVGSWSQELVTSVFVNVDLKGKTLYTQLHGYVLMPIRAEYHEVDGLPERVSSSDVWSMAWSALKDLLVEVAEVGVLLFTLPFRVPGLLRRLKHSVSEGKAVEPVGLTDWGARVSLREMAASRSFHHFFQEADAAKYLKIVERRTLDVILDFLEEHRVDTAEYRDRQTTLLNVGIMQTGSGTVVNNGPMATGPQAKATTGGTRTG